MQHAQQPPTGQDSYWACDYCPGQHVASNAEVYAVRRYKLILKYSQCYVRPPLTLARLIMAYAY